MKATGIVRRVDELGRIVIPIELRNKLEITQKDQIEIYVEGSNIILKKFEENCIFCGGKTKIKKYQEKAICKKCRNEIVQSVIDIDFIKD